MNLDGGNFELQAIDLTEPLLIEEGQVIGLCHPTEHLKVIYGKDFYHDDEPTQFRFCFNVENVVDTVGDVMYAGRVDGPGAFIGFSGDAVYADDGADGAAKKED